MFPFVFLAGLVIAVIIMIIAIRESIRLDTEIKQTIKKQTELLQMLEKEFKETYK